MLVFVDQLDRVLAWRRHGDNLPTEFLRLAGRFGLGLRSQRKLILFAARNLIAFCKRLDRHPHVHAMESVDEPVNEHGVRRIYVSHSHPGALPVEQMRRLRHTVLPAGDDNFGVATANRLSREMNRSLAGAAYLIDCQRRNRHGKAGLQSRLPRRILSGAAGENLAENDLGHRVPLNAALIQKASDHGGPEIGSGERTESASEFADRSALRRRDIGFNWHRKAPLPGTTGRYSILSAGCGDCASVRWLPLLCGRTFPRPHIDLCWPRKFEGPRDKCRAGVGNRLSIAVGTWRRHKLRARSWNRSEFRSRGDQKAGWRRARRNVSRRQ